MTTEEMLKHAIAAGREQDRVGRDNMLLPRDKRDLLNTLMESILKISESLRLGIEISANAVHPHEDYRSGMVFVREQNEDGSTRRVWSRTCHLDDL